MGIGGSCYNLPKAIFYLHKGDYILTMAVVNSTSAAPGEL